ncbi:MAG: BatD family protein [Fusobacteriaceae bacterium]
MKKIMKSLIFLTLFQIFSFAAYGVINLSADRNSLSIEEAMRLRVEFVDEESKNYRIDGLEKFQVMGKSSSKSISIINLKKSSQEREDYLLKPIAPGKYTLKVITSKSESKPLEIEVLNSVSRGLGSINSPGGNQIQDEFLMISTLGEQEKERKYYFGEKIFIEEKFLLFQNPRGFSVISRPEYKDFLEKDFTPRDRNGNSLQNMEIYQGRDALRTLLYRGVIQGTSSGKKQVKGIGVEVVTGDYYYPGALKKEIEILPLPEGKPENFKGIVGKLNMDYSFNRKSVQAGEALLLNIKLSGDVNLDNIEKIGITSDENFTIYETLKSSDERADENGYYSEKNFEIAFIPKRSGELPLPEIGISYLDTESGRYMEKKVEGEKIDVAGGNTPIEDEKEITAPKNKNIETIQSQIQEEKKVEKSSKLEFVENISFLEKLFKNRKIIIMSFIINFLLMIFLIFISIKKLARKIGKRESKPWEIYLKKMKKRSEPHEFYENYCNYMRERYNFNPKTQSEKNLKNEILEECNRKIERAIYLGEEIDRKEIIKKMREAD